MGGQVNMSQDATAFEPTMEMAARNSAKEMLNDMRRGGGLDEMLDDAQRGAVAEADGNSGAAAAHSASGSPLPADLGPNNERLGTVAPRLVNALRELVEQYRMEGLVARRHEIRRIRQARL